MIIHSLRRLSVVLATATMCAVVIMTTSAQAHVIVKDDTTGTGAVLHIAPGDDPVGGQISSLHYEIDTREDLSAWQAQLRIEKPQYDPVLLTPTVQGSSVFTDYTFPSRGVYTATLTLRSPADPAAALRFAYTVRVTRGVTGQALQEPAPAWAKSGLILTAWVLTGLALTAYSRRASIARRSRGL